MLFLHLQIFRLSTQASLRQPWFSRQAPMHMPLDNSAFSTRATAVSISCILVDKIDKSLSLCCALLLRIMHVARNQVKLFHMHLVCLPEDVEKCRVWLSYLFHLLLASSFHECEFASYVRHIPDTDVPAPECIHLSELQSPAVYRFPSAGSDFWSSWFQSWPDLPVWWQGFQGKSDWEIQRLGSSVYPLTPH